MLQAEQALKYSTHPRSWSPKLAFDILEVRLWRLISSAIINKHNNSNRINSVISRIFLLPVSLFSHPLERKDKIIVKKNLKTNLNNLKIIKKDALQTRERHLRYFADKFELDGNLVHATYLRKPIVIERQINMQKNIQKHTFNKI